jgi:hypothetical protein
LALQQFVTIVIESDDERLPSNARFTCQAIVAQLHAVQIQIRGFDKRTTQAHRGYDKRLDAIPGFRSKLLLFRQELPTITRCWTNFDCASASVSVYPAVVVNYAPLLMPDRPHHRSRQ